MEDETHVAHYYLIGVGKKFVSGMVTELTRTKSIESSDSAEQTWLFGKFFIDKLTDRPECYEPCPLDVVHFVG